MQQLKVDYRVTLLDKGIYQIKAISKNSTKLFLDTKESPQSDNWWNIAQCKFWRPKEGEWCWFWNEYSKYTLTLGKLARYSEEEKLYFSYNGVVYMSYKHCEPFIGELPSFLKDSK